MSVTISNLGSNSRKLEISGETNVNAGSGIIEGINTALTALGWTLYDTVVTGSRNCFVTKVYTAVCDDGGSPSTKYMILKFDAPRRFWYVSCAEGWNDTTHIATNECWTQNRAFPLPLQLSNSIIYIWATTRYAVFQASVRGELSPWQGIFEVERIMPDDSPSQAPCFGYTNQFIIGSPYYFFGALEGDFTPRNHVFPFWMPRTPVGTTGGNAIRACNIIVNNIPFPPNERAFIQNSNTSSLSPNTFLTALGTGIAQINPNTFVYNANSTLRPIMDMSVGSQLQNFFEYGRIRGLKLTYNFGSPLDTFTVPIDGNLFYSNTGSNNSHYILPISGGAANTIAIGANRLYHQLLPQAAGGANSVIFDTSGLIAGRYIYNTIGTANNTQANVVAKLDLDTGTWSNIAVPGTAEAIIYDGGNNVYVTTGVGVSRISVVNDSISNLTSNLVGGASALAINDTYLAVTNKTPSVNNKVDVINLSTFTVDRQIGNLVPMTLSATHNVQSFPIMTSIDYSNDHLFCMISGWSNTSLAVSVAQEARYYRIFAANGFVATSLKVDMSLALGGDRATNTGISAYYYSEGNTLFYGARGPATANVSLGPWQHIIDASNGSFVNTTSTMGQGAQLDNNYNAPSNFGAHPFKINETPAFKGYRIGNGHRGGIGVSGGGAIPALINYNHHHGFMPLTPFTLQDVATGLYSNGTQHGMIATTNLKALADTANSTNNPFGPVFTDGCAYYRMFSTQNSGVIKGQADQTRNNVGIPTPVLLIPS